VSSRSSHRLTGQPGGTANLHPNEIEAVEAHQQTAHKLEVMGRYFKTYLSVLAQDHKKRRHGEQHIWIVDCFAGAGLHRSADHADGATPGTALQAVLAAYGVQKRFPATRVHVRLIDAKADYCRTLEERVRPFTVLSPRERVDVKVLPGTFEAMSVQVIDEMNAISKNSFSLWLADPYNANPIGPDGLRPLLSLKHSELIVNLDSGGLNRMYGVVAANAPQKEQNAAALTVAFGSAAWRTALQDFGRVTSRDCDAFALAYAAVLKPYFGLAEPHALRVSDNQFRHLVHFARHPTAMKKFNEDYEASQKVGILKGRSLSDADRARVAQSLFALYRGTRTTLDDVYGAQGVLDRTQIATVFRYASLPTSGYGIYDEVNKEFEWFKDRVKPAAMNVPDIPGDRKQTSLFDTE